MTPQQIVGVAVRLFAIWLVLTALQAIVTGVTTNSRTDMEPSLVPYLFSGLFLVVAAFLWFFPMTVAHGLVPKTKYDNALAVPMHQAVTVAAVILGLWLLVARAIPAISFYATVAAYWSRNGQSISAASPSQHAQFVVGLIEFGIALVLLLKAPEISKFIAAKHHAE